VGIEQRPEVVDKCIRFGDLEADFMMVKAHKSALLVITDRSMLLTRLKKVDTPKQMLARGQKSLIKTLTFGNDKGFANHASIARTLDANVYFTRPYTSQDKATVENRIGVIRQFFQKGTDLRNLTKERIKTVESYLNNRPIWKIGYLSPI